MMKNKIKSEKGSITVLVLATVLFFMTILSTAYMTNTTIRKKQLESTIKIKNVYASEMEQEEKIYSELTKNSVYKEDFLEWNNYVADATIINSCKNGILTLTSTSNDPNIHMRKVTSFNPKINRYIEVKYRITNNISTIMQFYCIENPTSETYAIGKPLKSDGQWHTVVFDLWGNTNVKNREEITGWRFDWCTTNNVKMEIDYIRVF